MQAVRIEIEAAKVEVDRSPESLPLTVTESVGFDLLDHGVEAFGSGRRHAGHHVRADAVVPPKRSGTDKWNFLVMSPEEIHMKKSRFSEHQILQILNQAEAGTPVAELCREHGISSATFYNWRSKYGGMDASMMARMKELEAENWRLKKMYAEERRKAEIVQEALARKS